MAINRADIAKELLPGLNAIFGLEYGMVDDELAPLYETENSEKAFEEEVLFTMFGEAPTKAEGAAVQYDSAQESYASRYTHETVALAFAVTEEAMEDNLYDTFAKVRAKGLARAMGSTKQVKAANTFNNAFSGSYLGGDGVALISDSHPTVGDGDQSNKIGTAAISMTTLETAITNISKIKDDRGIMVAASAQSVISRQIWRWKRICSFIRLVYQMVRWRILVVLMLQMILTPFQIWDCFRKVSL